MARRKENKVDLSSFDQAGARVFDNPLVTEVSDSYLEYAFSVIHSRALPDARDGLKPVHRRILWSMYEQGYRPDRGHVKSARIVGDCFVAGTLVSTPDGLRAIEEVEVGDLVLDGDGASVPVTAVYQNPTSELVRVTWSNGHTMLSRRASASAWSPMTFRSNGRRPGISRGDWHWRTAVAAMWCRRLLVTFTTMCAGCWWLRASLPIGLAKRTAGSGSTCVTSSRWMSLTAGPSPAD